jgi:hypothetical protein
MMTPSEDDIEEGEDPEVQKARKQAAALKALTQSEGWSILKTILEGQVRAITDKIMLAPRGSQRDEYVYEFDKGQAAGMRIAIQLPYQEYDMNKAVARSLEQDGRRADSDDSDIDE